MSVFASTIQTVQTGIVPSRSFKRISEIRNVGVDFTGVLDTDEILLSAQVNVKKGGTIVVSGTTVTLSEVIINGARVAPGRAVVFQVSSGDINVAYTLGIEVITNASLPQTINRDIIIDVIGDDA